MLTDLLVPNNPCYTDFPQVLNYRITSQSEIPPEIPIVTFNEALWVKQGSFGVIAGKPKTGKSTVLEVIIVQALRSLNTPVKDTLGFWVEPAGNDKHVIVGDTEQSPQDVKDSIARINKALGRPEGDDDPRLLYFSLREIDTNEEVRIAMNTIIENVSNIHLVIIDGIADLISDPFSDAKGARALVRQLMMQTSKYNFAMIVAIHENYRDEKLTGHLGTELSKKTNGVLTTSKNKKHHTVKASILRKSADPEPTYFVRDNEGVFTIDKPTDSETEPIGLAPRTLKLHRYFNEIFSDTHELDKKAITARMKSILLREEPNTYTDPQQPKLKTFVSSAIKESMHHILQPVDGRRDFYWFRPIEEVS